MNVRDMFNLSEHVAIVTGGEGHVGSAITMTLAELGASIIIASINEEKCISYAKRLQRLGMECIATKCDVTKPEEVDSLIKLTDRKFGRLDVIVCAAGGSRLPKEIPRRTLEEFRTLYENNVVGTYLCATRASEMMKRQRKGSIITIGSIHGFLTSDPRNYEGLGYERSGLGYFAAKGAIINLTRSLAAEYGEFDINVNCISPGYMPYPNTDPRMVEIWRNKNPLRKTGKPENLKGVIALLSSSAGSWITGQNIIVDGGWSIW